jgi:DNA helicase-2/ATP-dependent DNA helicase PcrA
VDKQNFDFSPGVDVTDVYQVKGLEYDYVVLLEATAEQYPDSLGEPATCSTSGRPARAHQLWVVCSTTPTPLLPPGSRAPVG